MKKIALVIFATICMVLAIKKNTEHIEYKEKFLPYFSQEKKQNHFPDPVVYRGALETPGQTQIPVEEITSRLESLPQIETQFLPLKTEEIRAQIKIIEMKMGDQKLIEKANSQTISAGELADLVLDLRQKAVLHKILIDRGLREIGRGT